VLARRSEAREEAKIAADPVRRVARWFFYGFLTLAVAGLATCGYSLSGLGRRDIRVDKTRDQLLPASSGARFGSFGPARLHKIVARSKGVSVEYSDSLPVGDLLPGLRARDPRVIDHALRGGGLVVFVLSSFLAIGTAMIVYDDSAEVSMGWGFIGFVVLWVAVMSYRVANAPKDDGKQ
jgi:hypothetical protein